MQRSSSRRELIREVIERRRRCGEALTVRAIRDETGGSNSTILEELQGTPANGHATSADQSPAMLMEALRRSHDREAALAAENRALRSIVDRLEPENLVSLMQRADDTYRMLIVEVDRFRHAASAPAGRSHEGSAPTSPRSPEREALQTQIQGLLAENLRLSDRIRDLEYELEYGEPRSASQLNPDEAR